MIRCTCTSLRRASRKVSQMYDAFLAPSGLKGTQYSILAELQRRASAPPSMNELAEALVMDRSTLGHNLGPLERDGLVALAVNTSDRRSRTVSLTARGLRAIEGARPYWDRAQKEFDRTFGAEQARSLRIVLQAVADTAFHVHPAAVPARKGR
jgi:DNA-binding MarR family transcriptional regulator